MAMTDPIADMLTRIRNAVRAKHDTVSVPASRVKGEILRILQEEGYIEGFEKLPVEGKNNIYNYVVKLKYYGGRDKFSVITDLKRISKPGFRIYKSKTEIPKVNDGMGIAIISTSKGIVTDKQARKYGVGGEVICYVS